MKNIIYIVTNIKNGKQYVGQTIQEFSKRKKDHYYDAKRSGLPFHNAIRKYGIDNFRWIPIEYSIEELDEMERFWIFELKTTKPNGYNLETGGNANKQMSEESKRKNAEAHKGKRASEETRKKMSEKRIGTKRTLETKLKISKSAMGHLVSEETRKKMSKSKIGERNYWYGKKRPEHSQKMKEILGKRQ